MFDEEKQFLIASHYKGICSKAQRFKFYKNVVNFRSFQIFINILNVLNYYFDNIMINNDVYRLYTNDNNEK